MPVYIHCGFKFCLVYMAIPIIKYMQTLCYISHCPMEKWLLSSSTKSKVGALESGRPECPTRFHLLLDSSKLFCIFKIWIPHL